MTAFAPSLIGLPVSHVWRGHGSAIFLEFGKLRPSDVTRRDRTKGSPSGRMTLMLEWSWRIEGPRSIIAGSWSDEAKWLAAFAKLLRAKVVGIAPFGRLSEIDLTLSNGCHVVSFSTTDGQPRWALLDNEALFSLHVKRGKIVKERFSRGDSRP